MVDNMIDSEKEEEEWTQVEDHWIQLVLHSVSPNKATYPFLAVCRKMYPLSSLVAGWLLVWLVEEVVALSAA
jgi:hypothetical protein